MSKATIGWEDIQKMEQARWLRLAAAHAHESVLCLAVASNGTVTKDQAARLGRLATANNWPIPSVGRAAARRRRKTRTT